MNTTSTVALKLSVSKLSSSRRYLSRLIEARLQALLSRCMYSLLWTMTPVVVAGCDGEVVDTIAHLEVV